MARTLLTGNILRSGSIPTTALGGGVVTSSLQIIASLPTGSLSSSAQVNYPDISNIPGGIASSSAQIKDYLPVDTVSSSVQVTAFLPTGTVSSSTQLPSGIASSSAQVTAYLPTGTVSSSGQISVFNTINGDQLATTGSNTFTAPQTISDTTNSTSYLDGALHVAGGMSVRKDVRVSGSLTVNGLLTAVSMSTQYVTSSQYVVGDNKIILNDDDVTRFSGMSIIDSGSSSPTTASIYWDSLQHRFIYENLSGSAYNSSIIIAGPKHTGSLGDEPTLTTGYIPVATGGDHIDNSVMFQSGSNIGIGITNPSTELHVFGSSPQITISGAASSGNRGISFVDGNAAKYNFFVGAQNNVNNAFEITPSTAAGGTTYSTPALLINSSGNVGIGTTVTDALLEISKAITFTSVDTYPQLLVKASGGSTGRRLNLAVDDTNNVAFIQAVNRGTDVMNLSLQRYGGNVGIGTTNPNSLLEVYKASGTNYIYTSNGDANTFSGLMIRYSTTDYMGFIGNPFTGETRLGGFNASGYFTTIFSNNAETMRITAGNVGIGITNPSSLLHVYGRVSVRDGYNIGSPDGNTGIYFSSNTANIQTNGSNRFVIDSAGNVYTTAGSPISYGEGETYTIWSNEPEVTAVSNDANWKNMKTFICSKSGTLKFKFSAYISSGTYYWAWRILKNGATVVASGSFSVGLDTGETASVHAYRRFVATVGPIAAGDSLVLQMISASGGGTPVTGNGQTLYAKEFRAYSTVPSVEHGGASNIWGDRIGIGTITPSKKLEINFTAANDGLLVTGPQRLNGVFQSTGEHSWVYIDSGHSNTYLPALWLQRTSTTYGSVRLQRASNSDSLGAYVESEMVVGTETNTPFSLQTNAVRRMVITGGGNVGIGTTNPGYKLDVLAGSTRFGYVITQTVAKSVPENSSDLNFFKVDCPSSTAVQIIVKLLSWNSPTGAHTIQIYQAGVATYYSGRHATGVAVSTQQFGGGGGSAYINSVSLSGSELFFRVSSTNNGTGTSATVQAVVEMHYMGSVPTLTGL